MIELGSTDFYIADSSLPRNKFEEYSVDLFDAWERQVSETLSISDYSLELEIEEGSVSGKAKIAAALAAIYFGVGNYGSFIQGLEIIGRQIRSAGEFLSNRACIPFGEGEVASRIQNRGGMLTSLRRLFVKVHKREITPEQAMQEAEDLLGDDAQASPEFMHKLRSALTETQLAPDQMPLPMIEQEIVEDLPVSEREPKPRRPKFAPVLPPPHQLRVKVWKESKKGRRKISVTEI